MPLIWAAVRIESWAAISVIQQKALGPKLIPDTKYPEKELNPIIAKYHDGTAALRRYMIEYRILERDAESVYWLCENVPLYKQE
jgi:hypothetical protein